MCALQRWILSLRKLRALDDYSSGQSPALATSEGFCFTPEDQALGVLKCWFGSFVVVIVELFMLLCISDKVAP